MNRENRNAINIYSVYDNELERMHTLLLHYMAMPKDQDHRHGYPPPGMSGSSHVHADLSVIYKRIQQLQDVLVKCIKERDEAIQDKVAELALTGDSETK